MEHDLKFPNPNKRRMLLEKYSEEVAEENLFLYSLDGIVEKYSENFKNDMIGLFIKKECRFIIQINNWDRHVGIAISFWISKRFLKKINKYSDEIYLSKVEKYLLKHCNATLAIHSSNTYYLDFEEFFNKKPKKRKKK